MASSSPQSHRVVLSPLHRSTSTSYAQVQTPRSFVSHDEDTRLSISLAMEDPRAAAAAERGYDLAVDPAQFDRATHIKPMSLQRPHMRVFHISWFTALPGFLGWYAIPPLMPVIKDQLGLTTGEILDSDIASTASTIISRIVVGPLLELFGPQHVQSLALGLGAIPIACAAFVTSATGLLIVRFVIGLVGCIFVSSQFWTTIMFAKNVVGTSNAISGGLGLSGIGFAFLILPYVNQWLAASSSISDDLAWRLTIALPAVVMVLMALVAYHRADSCPMGEFHHLRQAQLAAADANAHGHGQGHSSSTPGSPPSQLTSHHLTTPAPENTSLPPSATTTTAATTRIVGVASPTLAIFQRLVRAFGVVLADANTYVLILHYAVSFGAELQLNNMGALYFYEEFLQDDCDPSAAATVTDPEAGCHVLSKTHASLIASTFGLMNMFARALGGLASDHANRRFGIRGRQCVQFSLLFLQGAVVITLSRMTALGPCIALYILVAITAQAAGGSTFGIVPYVNEAFTGTVTGLVGAGGNIGGVVFGIIFRVTSSRADGLLIMGCIILASSFFAACIVLRNEKGQRLQ